MAGPAVTPDMEAVLEQMRGVPLAQKRGTIHDVRVKTLRKWADPRGYFIEQLKRGDLDDSGRPMFERNHEFSQLSRSLSYSRGGNPPELIKAFHWHKKQWDFWDVVTGNARAVLVDVRGTSPTAGTIQELAIGENAPLVLGIPPGVLHGYQCLSKVDVILNYYVTEPYDPEDPDEGRVDWDDERIGFDWRVGNG